MQMVEFDSYVENGVIPIPSRYKDALPGSIKVLVFPNSDAAAPKEADSARFSGGLDYFHGIFKGMDAPDKKELRRIFHEKHPEGSLIPRPSTGT